MTQLTWDQAGKRTYETGVDHGVLYVQDASGAYPLGVVWNGLTTVTESPSGAEATPMYADNIKYLNLISAEQFGATIEAFTFPDEFGVCDGTASPEPGFSIGQQPRKPFGFCYRTRIGNDLAADDAGYKLHIVYGASAAPSEKAYSSVNETPEAIDFSWAITTVPVAITGYKPTALLTFDSTKLAPAAMAALELILYGSSGVDPRLPTPDEVVAIYAGSLTTAAPTVPTFVSGTGVITIPTVTGVKYVRDDTGATLTTTYTIPVSGQSIVVRVVPLPGYKLPVPFDPDWMYTRS